MNTIRDTSTFRIQAFTYELRNGKDSQVITREVAAVLLENCRTHHVRRRRGRREFWVLAVHGGRAWDRLVIQSTSTPLHELFMQCLAAHEEKK